MSGFKSPNHTQVPNDFFDMIADMSETELRVTLVMIRETRGWHRDAAKLGKQEMADRSGLSFNGVTAGCEAAEQRGIFRRTNPDAKTKAEWELINDDEPSTIEGVNPQPLRESPSTIEGQVRVKESIKKVKEKIKAATPRTPIPPEIIIFREVTKLYPPKGNWEDVVKIIQSVSARLLRPATVEDLRPFFNEWTFRGFKPTNIKWTSWAVTGIIPQYKQQNANQNNNMSILQAFAMKE